MDEEEEEGPFRYRSGVRVIAVIDAVLSVYLLAYLGVMVFLLDTKDTDIPLGSLTLDQHAKITLAIWIAILVVHSLQLIVALILICATSNSDASTCRAKCRLWLWFANFLVAVLVFEIVLLVFNFSRHGMRVYPMAAWGAKIIFRLIARQLVKYYIKDLALAPLNTVEAQFYSGVSVPRMYQYSSEYLAGDGPGSGSGTSKKKEHKY